eukprot:CAMPEP_0118655886 /NCGR_PEP_ID=MMETSP0785-20121206/13187_1 /TAXON_ID=91992 /ORGANISM="Bolidomonas pacifica, Strain CCMP 1866" /LENGTH=310 /DNA_ID=CAMNT_0006548693 /DNA_START=34 /DNA_END=962 /DNA_ORIENTATION=+
MSAYTRSYPIEHPSAYLSPLSDRRVNELVELISGFLSASGVSLSDMDVLRIDEPHSLPHSVHQSYTEEIDMNWIRLLCKIPVKEEEEDEEEEEATACQYANDDDEEDDEEEDEEEDEEDESYDTLLPSLFYTYVSSTTPKPHTTLIPLLLKSYPPCVNIRSLDGGTCFMSAVQGLDNLHGLGSSFASSGLKRLKKIIETTIESVGVCNVAYDATLKDFVEDGEDGEEAYPDTFNEEWFKGRWNVCGMWSAGYVNLLLQTSPSCSSSSSSSSSHDPSLFSLGLEISRSLASFNEWDLAAGVYESLRPLLLA